MLDRASAIPEHILINWQHTVDVMADVFEVPAGLIMRVRPGQLEVLVAARKEGNPYRASETAELNTGLYCESVMDTRAMLHVPNALDDVHWKDNPDVSLDMIAYLGVPPRCQNGCRSDRFGKLGGDYWSKDWHDTDKNLKIGRSQGCFRQRIRRPRIWRTKLA